MVKQFLLKGFLIIFVVLLQVSVVGVLLSGLYLHEFSPYWVTLAAVQFCIKQALQPAENCFEANLRGLKKIDEDSPLKKGNLRRHGFAV